MIDLAQLHPRIAELLLASGWTQERCVDVSGAIATLEHEGYRASKASIGLLTSLHGLRVSTSGLTALPYVYFFDPVQVASGEYDRVLDWKEQTGVDYFPLGREIHNGSAIWHGSDGRFYFGYEFGLYRVGDTVYEAFSRLFLDNGELVQCAE